MSTKQLIPELKLESFERAFSTHGGGCRRECECGREFYNPDGGWDWEKGEIEGLEQRGATALDWTVSTIEFQGVEYCVDCDCWHYLARNLIALIETDAVGIAEFLNLERDRGIAEAQAAPKVRKTTP